MGVFLVVHGSDDFVQTAMSDEKLDSYNGALHIKYDNRTIVTSKNKRYGFIHFERKNAIYSTQDQSYITTENDKLSATFTQGYMWNKATPNIINAEKLHSILKTGDPNTARDALTGEYSAISYNEHKDMLVAFNDRLSIEHIYFYSKNNQIIISNRIRLITEVIGSSSPNLETLNWIAATGCTVGDSTSEVGINKIPQGGLLKFNNNKLEIVKNDLYMFDEDFDRQVHNKNRTLLSRISPFKKKITIDKIIDQGIEECANNISLCLDYSKDHPFGLSGGKDSRAILALVKSLGKGDKINVKTNGFDGHPDVIVAKMISDHYGLSQKRVIPKPPRELDTDFIVNKLKGHVFQTDGMLGAWDAKGYTSSQGGVNLSGHVGEVYRSPYNFQGVTDIKKIAKLVSKPSNILNQSSNEHYQRKLEERFSFYLENGAMLNDLAELFYTVERAPNWVGSLRRVDGYSSCLVNPLNTETFIKLAYSLGHDQRKMERIHFEIINRLDPWLASLSFAGDKWDKRLQEYAGTTILSNDMIQASEQLPRFATSWQYKLKESEEYNSRFLDIFTSFPNSPMWNYYDKSNIEDKFKNKKFTNVHDLIGTYGFINAFFYTHKIEVPMKINTIKGC